MSGSSYRVLILGDTYFGESYETPEARVIADRGYLGGLEHLGRFTTAADSAIANLATPLLSASEQASSMAGLRPLPHWADPDQTVAALQTLNVEAVNLANNRTLDQGVSGLSATLENLDRLGMKYFGAGTGRAKSEAPHRVHLPESVGGGQLTFQGSATGDGTNDNYDTDAQEDTLGPALLSEDHVESVLVPNEPKDVFRVAFPHWGPTYRWRSGEQRRLARVLIRRGYDLVLGHGSHCMQEIERTQRHWVVYGIGNGHLQSPGDFGKFLGRNRILPMSLWVMLHVEVSESGERHTHLRLYPVYSDNRATGFRPSPVTTEDFKQVVGVLGARARGSATFANDHMFTGEDDLGSFIRLELGEWPISRRPPRPPRNVITVKQQVDGVPETLAADPNVDTLPTTQPNTYDSPEALNVLRLRRENTRGVGPAVIARAAEKAGAEVVWFSRQDAYASFRGRRVLISGHTCTESAVSGGIVADKHLSKELLREAGVSTPPGRVVHSADDAVAAAKELARPVVVKPRNGHMGYGITVNITSADDIEAAYYRALIVEDEVLVEAFISGLEYRCHATSEECVGAFRRVLPHVEGDGRSTVAELIRSKNKARSTNPTTVGQPIPTDDVAEGFLTRRGLTWTSVIPAGRRVVVRDVNGITSGGDSEECLGAASEELKATAAAAVKAIPGMDWGGVDILVERDSGELYVLEVNTNASINGSVFPVFGQPREIASAVWERIAARATADPEGEAVAGDMTSRQRTIGETVTADWNAEGTAPLHSVVRHRFIDRGEDIAIHTRRIFSLERQGQRQWFDCCLTEQDQTRSVRYLNRHGLLLQMLAEYDVPSLPGQSVRTTHDFNEFMEGQTGNVALLPAGRVVSGPRRFVFESGENPPTDSWVGRTSWVAQPHPEGLRIRTIATPQRLLLSLGEQEKQRPNFEQFQQAATVAVRAVRAVPGLRWAWVELVLPAKPLSSDCESGFLVESMTARPMVHRNDPVLSGSLDDFLEVLSGPSN